MYNIVWIFFNLTGEGNIEITLSIESNAVPEDIRKFLDLSANITSNEGSKIVINVPNSPRLPDVLDEMERRKNELGITGISVSLITLEQVFLR